MRDRSRSVPEEATRFQAIEQENNGFLKLLEERGAVQHIDGRMVFDPEGIKSLMKRDKAGKYWEKSMDLEQVKAGLAGLQGYTKSDLDNPDFQAGRLPPREVLPLPKDTESLTHGYSETAANAVVNIWDLEPNVKWGRKMKLDSGEEVNTGELFVAAQLTGPLKSRRNKQGELEIFNPTENQFVKFTFNEFERLVGKRIQVTDAEGRRNSFHDGALFVEKYLPNLLKAGVLKREDIRTTSGSKSHEILGSHERKVSPSTPFVQLGGKDGSAKYYIGRNKLQGTNISTEAIAITQLDSDTAGIIENTHGRKRLIYTFRLLSPQEIKAKRELVAQNKSLKPGEISARTVVGAEEMKDRMANYDITQFVPKRSDETPEQYAKRVADLSDIDFVTRKFQGFFAEAGIGVHNLPWSEQLVLANAILQEKDRGRLIAFAKKFGMEGVRTFLSLDYSQNLGSSILKLGERLPTEQASRSFKAYSGFFEKVQGVVIQIAAELKQEHPDLVLDEKLVINALVARARDYLVELVEAKPDRVEATILELEKEKPREQVIRAEFKAIATLLNSKNIDLRDFEQQQELVLRTLVKGEAKALAFRVLNRMGKLAPIPEIHWRVDRSNQEYSRRLGVNLVDFLQARTEGSKRKQVLLEIGPGSGMAKSERAWLGLPEHYQDVALSDKIYYSLAQVLEKLIDYSKLEQATGAQLTPEEKTQLADFVYKTLVIARGQTSSDSFAYDEQNQTRLTEDINNLKDIISQQLSERLKAAFEVPDTISVHRDGKVVYPYKVKADSWPQGLQAAKKLLEDNPTEFLRPDWNQVDCYNLIDAFPANVMVGDLSQISRLKAGQVDVELAVRSTVYKREHDYVEFLGQLMRTLNQGGVAIDDSIRDNDGWYYRIAEVLEAKEKTGPNNEVLVVLGPGFPGEDKRQDRVPLSMVITKAGSSVELVRKNLLLGYEIVRIEDLASDQEYLATLDDTGLTRQKTIAFLEAAA